jgi:hypothetical protein
MDGVVKHLLAYSAQVRDVARRAAGSGWNGATETVTELAAAPPRPDSSAIATLLAGAAATASLCEAADLFLDPKWVDRLRTERTETYVSKVSRERAAVRAEVDAWIAQHETALLADLAKMTTVFVAEVAGAAVYDPGTPAGRYVASALEHVGRRPASTDRLVSETLARFLQEVVAAGGAAGVVAALRQAVQRAILGVRADALETRPDAHPTLMMGLTFGNAPQGKERLVSAPPGTNHYDVATPRSENTTYDLFRLLGGVPGVLSSGLNHTLVAALDVIRPAAPPAGAEKGSPDALWRRDDATPAWRQVGPRADLAAMLKGPNPELAAYNALAEAVLADPADGMHILDPESLVDAFTAAAEHKEIRYQEILAVERAYRADPPPAAGPGTDAFPEGKGTGTDVDLALPEQTPSARAASSLAALRWRNAQAALVRSHHREALAGAYAASKGEQALTCLVQADRLWSALQREVGEDLPETGSGARARFAAATARALDREEAGALSLKMECAGQGRPARGV